MAILYFMVRADEELGTVESESKNKKSYGCVNVLSRCTLRSLWSAFFLYMWHFDDVNKLVCQMVSQLAPVSDLYIVA